MNRLNGLLTDFESCFSRYKTFSWFVVIVIGFMVRTDHLGVTSIIRALDIAPSLYETMLHFFYSDAWRLEHVTRQWIRTVKSAAPIAYVHGHALLVGDGVKQPKEGRRMPGVKRQHQESDNSGKPEFMFGHLFGSVGVLAGKNGRHFCIPLSTTIQDGVGTAFEWEKKETRLTSHVVQMVTNGYEAAKAFGKALMVLDRYFLTVPALVELNRLNAEGLRLQIVTKAKSSCTAFLEPPPRTGKRGAPRKKGDPVKMKLQFQARSHLFETREVLYYGEKREVRFLMMDLLWGKKLYKKLRFVLVEVDQAQSILVSTDLTLTPVEIIETYCLRFKIETGFREMKQTIGGFGYHFWCKRLEKLNRYSKKDAPDSLMKVTEEADKKTILTKIRATEMFVLCANIAQGLLQILSLHYEDALDVKKFRYLRTPTSGFASEASMMTYIRNQIYFAFAKHSDLDIIRIIKSKQDKDFEPNSVSFPDAA